MQRHINQNFDQVEFSALYGCLCVYVTPCRLELELAESESQLSGARDRIHALEQNVSKHKKMMEETQRKYATEDHTLQDTQDRLKRIESEKEELER